MSLLQNIIEIVKRPVIKQKYNDIRSFDIKIVETFFVIIIVNFPGICYTK